MLGIRPALFCPLAALLAWFATGCTGVGGGIPCTTNADCPAGQVCAFGVCRHPDAGTFDTLAPPDSGMDSVANTDTSIVGRRCGPTAPCFRGSVCEAGVCVVDCGTRARCGDATCCAIGDVCYGGTCITPGPVCIPMSSADGGSLDASSGDSGGDAATVSRCVATVPCPSGSQCDPALGRCVPVVVDPTCMVHPGAVFAPQLLWAWDHAAAYPTFGHVSATPAVADLDGDGASDIVVPVLDTVPGVPHTGAILCALSGRGDCAGGPRELWCTAPSDPRVGWLAAPAIADLDGTGALTIIVGDTQMATSGGAVNGIAGYDVHGVRRTLFGIDGTGVQVNMPLGAGAPAIADLDGDGHAEIIVGFTVFDSTGRLRWQRPGGTGNHGFGPMTIAADLDGDGHPEVVGGNMAYAADGTPAWGASAAARTYADGWPAAADFDGDGTPEIVVVSEGSVRIFTHAGQLFSTTAATVPGFGGPPTIADLDGDGTPDIAVTGSNVLTAFHVGLGTGHPITPLWAMPSSDGSAAITGASVFDFDGDGRAEVIYADECYARAYQGSGDGSGATSARFAIPNTSCTSTEYPVVADVNGDGKAEFVVVSNDASGMGTSCSPLADACAATFPRYVTTHGVRVFRDGNDNWVATRALWNQHSYHVTNVCDGYDTVCPASENRVGGIPTRESSSWAFPAGAPLERYRGNAQITGVLAAADLVPRSFAGDVSQCGAMLGLQVDVANQGAIGVPAGVPVAFYRTSTAGDGGRTLLGVTYTTRVLLPGSVETVGFEWTPVPPDARNVPVGLEVDVNDDGTGQGPVHECTPTNDRAALTLTCSDIG